MFYKIHGIRILVYKNNKFLILKRSPSDKNDSNLWDIPGGEIKTEENIYTAIKRELLEETGIKIFSSAIKGIHGLIFEDFDATNKLNIVVFICQVGNTNIYLNSEHSDYQWINVKDLPLYKIGRILRTIKSSLQI